MIGLLQENGPCRITNDSILVSLYLCPLIFYLQSLTFGLVGKFPLRNLPR
jgi:hypothetical protein